MDMNASALNSSKNIKFDSQSDSSFLNPKFIALSNGAETIPKFPREMYPFSALTSKVGVSDGELKY
jgi:hypothetical protein